MKHRVTANLIISKLPKDKIFDVCFFEDSNFKCDATPKIGIVSDNKCEMTYKHVSNVKIKSPYYMQVEVEVNNETLIEELAREKFDLIIDNLSFLTNDFWGEYKIIKIDTWRENDWKTVWSIFSNAIRYPTSTNPSILKSGEVKQLKELLRIKDETYKKSLYYLGRGEKRLNRDLVRGKDRIDVETFLNLFKPVELISNDICKNRNKSLSNLLIFKFIKNLFVLDRNKAISKLCKEYKELKLHNLPNKIEKTGKILKISNNDIEKVIIYNKYRSKFDIAHARKSFTDEKIDYSDLCRLTHIFIKKYLDYKNLL